MKLKPETNRKYTQIAIYVVITVVVIYILTRIADNIGIILASIGTGLRWMGVIFTPLALGFMIAYILFPVMNFLEKRLGKLKFFVKRNKSAHGLSVALTCVFAVAVLMVLFSLIISTLTSSLQMISFDSFDKMIQSAASTFNSFYVEIEKQLEKLNISSDQLNSFIQSIGNWIAGLFKNMGSNIQSGINNMKIFFTNTLFAIIFGIYFLLDGTKLMKYWNRVLKAVSDKKFDNAFHVFMEDADKVFSGYIRGQLLDALFMSIMVSIALSLVGVKFAVIIGVLTGIGNLIPYVGPVVAYAATILVTLVTGEWQKLLVAIIVLLIIQTIDGNVINPKFLSNTIQIHPMLVIASLIIGSAAGGILGMLLAVPIGALIKIQFERLIDYLIVHRHLEEDAEPGQPEQKV